MNFRGTFLFMIGLWALAPAVARAADPDPSRVYPQTVRAVAVDYAVERGGLRLFLSTTPPLDACGEATALPATMRFDSGAVDVVVKDYAFIRGEKGACGPAYKSARTEVFFTHKDLAAHDVHQIRLWYKDTLDRITLTGAGSQMTVEPVGRAHLFKLGSVRVQPVAVSGASTPALTKVNHTSPSGEFVILTTGNHETDQVLRDRIAEIALTRGFAPTDATGRYTDLTGSATSRLKTISKFEVGALMVRGIRTPVYAVSAAPLQGLFQ